MKPLFYKLSNEQASGLFFIGLIIWIVHVVYFTIATILLNSNIGDNQMGFNTLIGIISCKTFSWIELDYSYGFDCIVILNLSLSFVFSCLLVTCIYRKLNGKPLFGKYYWRLLILLAFVVFLPVPHEYSYNNILSQVFE